MRKLTVQTFVTLDGVVQDPGGFGELERGGWALGFFDDASAEHATQSLLESDTFLLGRRTFEIIEKAWSANTGPYAEAMHRIPKVVVTNTLRGPLPWNATALPGDPAQTVAALKEESGGDILTYGSAMLVRTLLRHGLVDELVLGVHPVVLGTGKRFFDDGLPDPLRLVDAAPTATGVISLTYAPVVR
jgi:dihydrofolate reductase